MEVLRKATKDLILDRDSFLKQATISYIYLPFIVYYASSQKYWTRAVEKEVLRNWGILGLY